jgi:3,4-dihydroxy-2-butanone 4-phosphate synthase
MEPRRLIFGVFLFYSLLTTYHLLLMAAKEPQFSMKLNTIPEILNDLRKGRMVIVVDDEDRENEGDLIMAGEFTRPADINFMAKHGRGLICVPMEGSRLDELDLHPMATRIRDPYKTGWAISCDARDGVTTGISAHDRALTINLLADPRTGAQQIVKPGHIFPLRANEGGILVRAGHTEACVDLLKLARLSPAGVICEIMNDDGTMARLPDLVQFSSRHRLKEEVGEAHKEGGRHIHTDRIRKVQGDRLRIGHRQVPSPGAHKRQACEGRRSRQGPFRMPHRRRLRLAQVRLRRAA